MSFRLTLSLATLLLIPAMHAGAADIARGQSLVQQHCMSCHDNGVYTRPNRRINSLPGLQKQVRRCELSLGLKWFDDDINNVTGYLNETFYKF